MEGLFLQNPSFVKTAADKVTADSEETEETQLPEPDDLGGNR